MPIAQVARDLGINAGMLGNWVAEDSAEREGTQGLSTDDVAELNRLRTEGRRLTDGARRLKPFGGPVGERGTEVSGGPKPVVRHHNQSTLRDFWREGYPHVRYQSTARRTGAGPPSRNACDAERSSGSGSP